MACMQEIRAFCESDYSEKDETVSKGSHGYNSYEHTKHDHKSAAYSSQGGGFQAVGANCQQICNSASAEKHHIMEGIMNKHSSHSSGHQSLTEKVSGIFGSGKAHQSSGCKTHGHQTSVHCSHGHKGSNHNHQSCGHGSHMMAGHGSHGHRHKASREECYEFEEQYKSSKSGEKKVIKKTKKKSSHKSSSSESESD